ncbi:MAG: DUF4097 family beta strand repeat-containing protein [Trebonia sp.]
MTSTATSAPAPAPVTPLRMTRGRRAALAIGVPACLALIASTGLSLVANLGTGHYPVSYTAPASTTSLTLNVTGQLTIEPTTARQATLTGTARYSIVRPGLTEHTAGGATTVGYGCPIPAGECALDATVAVPASITRLSASSGAGNATVTGTTGPVNVSTGDGSLTAGHTSGPLALNTNSGNIQVSAARAATLSASTGDGDIKADGVSSSTITANTSSGSIEGTGVSAANITASSGQGDLTITLTSVPNNVRVNTNSGNITLILPRTTTTYAIAAHTDSGNVSDGTIRQSPSSTHVITATTGNGNITITER